MFIIFHTAFQFFSIFNSKDYFSEQFMLKEIPFFINFRNIINHGKYEK